jgi:hypothetical protein
MFIKVTNANPLHKGKALLLKADLILTVYEGTATREDDSTEEVTFVFSPDHGTWEVEDSADSVLQQLNEIYRN